MGIEALREQINRIDKELLSLFLERMETAGQVAAYKKENDLPVFDAKREREIIEAVAQNVPENLKGGASLLFSTMMDISKGLQYAQNMRSPAFEAKIADGIAAPQSSSNRVACQGVLGAYSHMAARALIQEPDVQFYKTFEDVMEAVARGECKYGLLPVENSSAGSVTAVYDLMDNYSFHIIKSIRLKISHCLLAKEPLDPAQITKVYSHPHALSQCSMFFSKHRHIEQVPCENTAKAASLVSLSEEPGAAAIASEECSLLYGLDVLDECPQNCVDNYTRFILITKRLYIEEGADRISLALRTAHEPGALCRLLTRFAAANLNLTKLESRPVPEKPFEFLFYFDFEGSVRDEAVLHMLSALSTELEYFSFLGNYSEITAE